MNSSSETNTLSSSIVEERLHQSPQQDPATRVGGVSSTITIEEGAALGRAEEMSSALRTVSERYSTSYIRLIGGGVLFRMGSMRTPEEEELRRADRVRPR